MKTASAYENKREYTSIHQSNAATRRQMLDRFVDQLLVVAIGAASVTTLFFFMTLA